MCAAKKSSDTLKGLSELPSRVSQGLCLIQPWITAWLRAWLCSRELKNNFMKINEQINWGMIEWVVHTLGTVFPCFKLELQHRFCQAYRELDKGYCYGRAENEIYTNPTQILAHCPEKWKLEPSFRSGEKRAPTKEAWLPCLKLELKPSRPSSWVGSFQKDGSLVWVQRLLGRVAGEGRLPGL